MSKVLKFSGFDEIYEYRIVHKCLEHSTLFLKTRIAEENYATVDEIVGRVIKADVYEEGYDTESYKYEKSVFLGIIDSAQIDFKHNGYCEITAHSFSEALDSEPKNRVFQNQKKSLQDILKSVCSYDGIVLKGEGIADETIPFPIVQHNETDWQFLLRVCKQFGYSVLTVQDFDNQNEGTIWIGNIERKAVEISSEQVITKSYTDEAAFIRFQDENVYDIGDSIILNNTKYRISSCDFYMENLAFIREYVMTDHIEEIDAVMSFEGLVIPAEVLAVEGEGQSKGQIQVKFAWEDDVPENPIWLDWVTSYSDTSVGVYNIPMIGENVLVTVLDSNGTNMIAHSCLRKSEIDKELKVTDKIIRIGEKEVLINDEAISVKNKDSLIVVGNEKIFIETKDGNWKLTNERSSIETDGDTIKINGNKIEIKGNQEVTISGNKTTIDSSSIVLKGMVEVK